MAAKKSTTKKSSAAKSTAKKPTAKKSPAAKKQPAKKVSPSVADAVERVKTAPTRGQKIGAMLEVAGAAIQKGAEIAETIKRRRRAKKSSARKKRSSKA